MSLSHQNTISAEPGQNTPTAWGIPLLLLVTFLLVFLRFGEFFSYGNSRVIEPYGDGYKSYHAVVYHAEYDSNYTHFMGMNYPYGEHVVPGDCQPLISNFSKLVSRHFIDINPFLLGMVNGSMLVSFILCSLFLFLIFRKMGLPVGYSIIVAVGLTFLSPQTHRMSSHYGLAHPVVLPMILYLLLRFEERAGWANSLLVALAVTAFSMIHFYYFAIMAFTITGYFFFSFLLKWKQKSLPTYVLHYAVQLLLPLAFFAYWIFLSDPVADRTEAPWGFFHYRSFPEGVFTSLTQPHFSWINDHLFRIKAVDMEAKAYIGLVGAAIFLVLILQWSAGLFRRPLLQLPLEAFRNRYLQSLFFTGGAILLFAFGIPFILPGLSGLLEIAGPIRQFRSIGRFAWVFYYSMNIVAFTWIFYRLWLNPDRRRRKWLTAGALLILVFEAYHFTNAKDLRLDEIPEFKAGNRFTDIDSLDYAHYQAILPIPYYNIGSDQFWWLLSGFIGQKSQTLSMQTGLPITGAMLTRTSLSQTINQLQSVTEPYRLPKLLEDLPDNRPLLMLWDTIRVKEYGDLYHHLQDGATLVYQNGELQFWELPLKSFIDRIEAKKAAVQAALDSSQLYAVGAFRSTDSLENFLYRSFDESSGEHWYAGEGSLSGKMEEQTLVFDGPLPAGKTGDYLLSIWVYIHADRYPRTELAVEEYLPETGEVLQRANHEVRTGIRVFDNNGWALLEIPFAVKNERSNVRWYFRNRELSGENIWLDELLIRPAATDLYRETDTTYWMNNRFFPKTGN